MKLLRRFDAFLMLGRAFISMLGYITLLFSLSDIPSRLDTNTGKSNHSFLELGYCLWVAIYWGHQRPIQQNRGSRFSDTGMQCQWGSHLAALLVLQCCCILCTLQWFYLGCISGDMLNTRNL